MAQLVGTISKGGETSFYLPAHLGPVTVTVNGSPATIIYQDADNVVISVPTQPNDLIEITYVPPDLYSGGGTGAPGPQGPAGPGVPTGGTTGQILAKASSTNYDTAWVTASSSTSGNLDGGYPDSIYGGIDTIDAGGI